jgi:hypothetical protein
VKLPARASGSHFIICPSCEAGELRSARHMGVHCLDCWYEPSRGILGALQQIIALPDALGKYACEECGHPEMHHLADGVSRCPGCGSEVLPTKLNSRTHAEGTSRSHREGAGGGDPDAVPAKKSSQRGARDAGAGRRQAIERAAGSLPASNKGCGDVANVRDRGGFKDVR